MPFLPQLIADSPTASKPAVVGTAGPQAQTTNYFSDKILCSRCMNRSHGTRGFVVSLLLLLFQTSIISCNHFYGVVGHRNTNEEASLTLKQKNDGPFLSLPSLKSLSLTSSSQLRMFEEKAIPKNVTAQIGHPVYLHCVVEPIGDKMVSWIRLRDFHLLTVGRVTYTSDDRFVTRHGTLQPNDWALQIKHVTPKDEGLYECQINSDPPRSQYYYLQVVVPMAKLVGFPDMFVKAGAVINLTCVISRSPQPPAFVFWYHNDRMINYDPNSNGETSVHKDPVKSDTVISRLVIRNAKLHDSGNYTCTPSNAEATSIYVHVLQGEKRLSSGIQNDEAGSNDLHTSNTSVDAAALASTTAKLIIFLVTSIDLIMMT